MKIPNSQTDIGAYLPKFYAKETHISNILNPLLKNIRESKVSSYSQLQGMSFMELRQEKFGNSIARSNVFIEKKLQNSFLPTYHLMEKQKANVNQKIRNLDSRQQKIFSQPEKVKNKQTQLQTIQHPQKMKNLSVNLRSKTSDLKKKYKKAHLVPCTADFSSNNMQQLGKRKKRFLFEKNESHLQNYDDQFSNSLQLKNLTKTPSISGGKFAKFNKHLVQEINMEQVQNKFYQNPRAVTNYQHFFQRIMRRRKQQLQNGDNHQNIKKHQTIQQIDKNRSKFSGKQSPIPQKEKGSCSLIKQSLSQTIDMGKSLEISRGINEQKSRKRSVRAVLLYKKDGYFGGVVEKQVTFQDKSLDSIQVTGKRKNLMFPQK